MNEQVRHYFSTIGRKGGRKSRRILSSKQAREMVRVREAKRAFRRFHASCFWSYDPELRVTVRDVSWISEQLMRNGNREAWRIGVSLCR